ncbi:MAG: hypothetical protein ACYC3S_00325 [Chloroflexota bacterium]
MRSVSKRAAMALALLLVMVSAVGCASSTPTPTPATVAQATRQAPTPTPWPTSTPTPKPTVTPTPLPSPTPGDAAAVIRQMQTTSQTIKSGRGSMDIVIEGKDQGEPRTVTMGITFEQNDPDIHMAMKMADPDGAEPLFAFEFIVKGDTAYMKMGSEWTSFPSDASEAKSQTDLVDLKEMESFLKDATNVKAVGRRNVKGVECDVVAFTLSQEQMLELARNGGSMPTEELFGAEVQFDDFTGEAAIGVTDKMPHQMIYKMSGYATEAPENPFTMTFTMTIWDINSPDVVITAPADVRPFTFEIPSPTPTREPLG